MQIVPGKKKQVREMDVQSLRGDNGGANIAGAMAGAVLEAPYPGRVSRREIRAETLGLLADRGY